MSDTPTALLLDLVEWVALRARPYSEVMAAWRTACPRLTVWEDACDAGYLVREWRKGYGETVAVTPPGHEFLRAHGRSPAASQATGGARAYSDGLSHRNQTRSSQGRP